MEYRRTKNGEFTQKKYYRSEKIVENAEKLLSQYAASEIDVRAKDQKIMAQYIETFASYEQDKLLEKLQEKAAFDVKGYLADSKKSYWQRLFHINPNKTKQLSVADLQKRVKEYQRINRKLANGWFHKEQDYQKQIILENQAKDYATDFLNDKIELTRQDIPALKAYLKAFYGQRSPAEVDQALNKINDLNPETLPEKRPSFWERFKTSAANKWNNLFKREQPTRASTTNNNRKKWIIGTVGSAVIAIAAAYFFKSDSKVNDAKQDKKEFKAPTPAPVADKVAEAKTITLAAAQELTSEQKTWKNFYDTKIDILSGAAKVNAADLYAKIEANLKAGIFTLPEGITPERFAYTHTVYRAYCLPSPLEAAINGSTKISAEQQAAIEEAIKIADKDGRGVRAIAAKQSQRMGRQLGSNSSFNHASKEMQMKYLQAAHEVKKLKVR